MIGEMGYNMSRQIKKKSIKKKRKPKPRIIEFTEANRQEGIERELDKMRVDPNYIPEGW
jgi:hypothetical protein